MNWNQINSITLLFVLLSFYCHYGYTQQEQPANQGNYPFVEEIKYTTFERSVYLIDSSIVDSLSFVDRSKITPSTSLDETHAYFDLQEDKVTEKQLLDHDNKYGDWYTPPDIFRYDKNGIQALRSEVWDTLLASQDYYDHYGFDNDIVHDKGLLNGLVFHYPDSNQIDSLELEGIQVTVGDSLITVSDSSYAIIYDLNNKSIATFFNDNYGIETTLVRDYEFNDTAGIEILSQFTEITRGALLSSVGSCIEHITQVDYIYNKIKPATQFSLRSYEKQHQDRFTSVIYPNPTNDYRLNVQLSGFDTESDISMTILDMTGRKLYAMDRADIAGTMQFNIPRTIPDGVYIVSIRSGEKKSSTKVIFNNN